MSITAKDCENLAKKKLSPKRFCHTLGVRDMALRLARLYGADPDRAEISALLHDIVKEEREEDCLQLLLEGGIIQTISAPVPRPVQHAPAGAVYAERVIGVTDPQILSAIACHTTGKPDMSLLDKILFIADATSAERDYPGVEELRRLALSGQLDAAVAKCLADTIAHVEKKGGEVDGASRLALASLMDKLREDQTIVTE